ncbi:MAG: YibE/F family protein, partial [Actinomycetota bacterium]|nr:YibE/F family protein [Actinomycetota bacterium]
ALWAARAALAVLAAMALLVAAGLLALWPREDPVPLLPATADRAVSADVISVSAEGCPVDADPACRVLGIELDSGERTTATRIAEAFSPVIEPGDRIRVVPNVPAGEAPLAQVAVEPYVVLDFDRRPTLLWLAIAFVVLVAVFGRRRGLRSLLGLAASLVLIATFVVPAILAGSAPLLVALVGAGAVLLLTLLVTHGVTPTSVAGAVGAAACLVLAAVLAVTATELAQLSGLVSEQSFLARGGGELSPQGLLVAGMVIGALGVLDDVTVSQASTVLALRRAAPALAPRELYARAMAVGRDHLGATVNTLALAYVGAALPVLLLFSSQGTAFTEAVNRELVAQEVVALLVGSIAIVAAVPLTTALATLLSGPLALAGAGAQAHEPLHGEEHPAEH